MEKKPIPEWAQYRPQGPWERYLASKADAAYRNLRRDLGLDAPLPGPDESINEARTRAGFPPMK